MTISEVYTQSFAAHKMKPKGLINDFINDLRYLYYIIRVVHL